MSSGESDPKPAGGPDVGLADTVYPDGDTALAVSTPASSPGLGQTDTLPSSEVRALGERPDSDKLVRAVARAKIAGQLFQKKEQVKLGRYHLLELIGAGGMGVVWGAWDPELDRLVAIKLVKAEMQGIRDRILLEGQALAKVSHPNIVPVYDVGVVEEQVYLVMEWVRGKNLRAYCKTPRTVKDVLAVYRSAGEGLIAAHAAGIIHRDFKPDNAILGDDGRVRVLDFGLARGEVRTAPTTPPDRTPSSRGEKQSFSTPSSDLTRGAGTPRYMPPEQAEGRELTPAVDQYAFCVSLRESLAERNADDKPAEVPKWIDEILTQGTAREAANRYPSMEALLDALARDPAVIRRRRLLVAGGVAVAGATFAVGLFAGGSEGAVERCAGGKDEIAKSWNAAIQDRMRAHLQTLGSYAAGEVTRIEKALAEYTVKWADAHQDACLRKERGVLTAQLYERNLGCLGRSRVAFETLVEVIGKSDNQNLPNAISTVGALPDTSRCLSETQTSTIEPPGTAIAAQADALANDIERARILANAQVPAAVPAAADAVSRALALSYKPLVARAHLVHGMGLSLHNQGPLAARAFHDATTSALEAGDERIAVESFARFIHSASSIKDLPADLSNVAGAIPMMEAISRRETAVGSFERYFLFNNVGVVHLSRGQRELALEWLVRARRERERVTSREPELNLVWTNLAMVTADPVERGRLMGREVTELENTFDLGPDHPAVLNAKWKLAASLEPPQDSLANMADACDRMRRLHSHLRERIMHCAVAVGWLAEELDDRPRARDAMDAIAKLAFPINEQPLEQRIAPIYIALVDGAHGEAMQAGMKLAETLAKDDHVYSQYVASDAFIIVARAALATGAKPQAIAALTRAKQILIERLAFLDSTTMYRRRKFRVLAMLAEQLVTDDPALAKRLAAEALDWYRQFRGYEARVRVLEQIVRGS